MKSFKLKNIRREANLTLFKDNRGNFVAKKSKLYRTTTSHQATRRQTSTSGYSVDSHCYLF